jgi:hypothetical protein
LPSATNIPRSNNFSKSFVEVVGDSTFYTEIKINGVFFIFTLASNRRLFYEFSRCPARPFLFPDLNKNKCGAAGEGGGEGGLLISLFY